MDIKEFDALLHDAEVKLKRLKALYEQWFQGIERIEPLIARKDLDRTFLLLGKDKPRNTAARFRLQQLAARYSIYVSYWQRIARQIEEGTFIRDVKKVQRNAQKMNARKSFEIDLEGEFDLDGPPLGEDEIAGLLDSIQATPSEPPADGAPKRAFSAFSALGPKIGPKAPSDPPKAAPEAKPATKVAATFAKPAAVKATFEKPPPVERKVEPGPALEIDFDEAFATKAPPIAKPGPPAAKPSRAERPPISVEMPFEKPPSKPPIAIKAPLPPPVEKAAPPPPPRAAVDKAPAKPAAAPPPPPEPRAVVPKPAMPKPPPPPPIQPAPVVKVSTLPPPVAVGVPGVRKPLPPRPKPPPPPPEEQRMKRLYDDYVAARRKNNENQDAMGYDKLVDSVKKMSSKLREKHGDKKIDFEVVVQDGKVGLKPKIK
jgi:hypothetical protein